MQLFCCYYTVLSYPCTTHCVILVALCKNVVYWHEVTLGDYCLRTVQIKGILHWHRFCKVSWVKGRVYMFHNVRLLIIKKTWHWFGIVFSWINVPQYQISCILYVFCQFWRSTQTSLTLLFVILIEFSLSLINTRALALVHTNLLVHCYGKNTCTNLYK
jgi:hypothetical protein